MQPHPVVHFEIGCRDGKKTREFFAKLFDWEITDSDAGMMIDTGDEECIYGHIAELAPEWGNYVTVYVEVDDIDSYLEKAVDLGGKALVPAVTLPENQGRFAWLAAPEGNIIGIWEPPTDRDTE